MGTRTLVCFACVLSYVTVCFGEGPLPIRVRSAPSKEAGGPQERTRLALEQIRSAADELDKLGFTDEAKSLRDTLVKILKHETANVNALAPDVKRGKKVASKPQKVEELRQVNCQIHIVELSGKALAKWKSTSKNPQNNSGPVNSVLKDGEGLLKTLQEAGDVKALSAPVIKTTLGQPATVMVGSELPILVSNEEENTNVEKLQIGVRCEVVAHLIESGKLQIDLLAEISERDDKHAVVTLGHRVPGLKTRRANTQSVLHGGETLVVSLPSVPSRQDDSRIGETASEETITLFLATPMLVPESSK